MPDIMRKDVEPAVDGAGAQKKRPERFTRTEAARRASAEQATLINGEEGHPASHPCLTMPEENVDI